VIGLGPAGPELTTIEAREILNDMGTVLLRTGRHPAAEPLIEDGARTLDHHYENAATFNEAYAGIVEEVVAAAFEHGHTYGTGNPVGAGDDSESASDLRTRGEHRQVPLQHLVLG